MAHKTITTTTITTNEARHTSATASLNDCPASSARTHFSCTICVHMRVKAEERILLAIYIVLKKIINRQIDQLSK